MLTQIFYWFGWFGNLNAEGFYEMDTHEENEQENASTSKAAEKKNLPASCPCLVRWDMFVTSLSSGYLFSFVPMDLVEEQYRAP